MKFINIFFAHTNAKLRQVRSELKSITKSEKSITKYLARIQRIEDILDSIDDPISHLEAILDGLPEDYNTLVSIIQYRSILCPNIEAESMLLPHEAKLDKSKKTTLTEPLSINITQANLPTPQSTNQCNFDSSNVSQFNAMSSLCESRGGFHGGRNFNRGGGRFGGRFIVQCQICFKHGHGGSICYHRHSPHPFPSHLILLAFLLSHIHLKPDLTRESELHYLMYHLSSKFIS